jgi:hypothetical protein
MILLNSIVACTTLCIKYLIFTVYEDKALNHIKCEMGDSVKFLGRRLSQCYSSRSHTWIHAMNYWFYASCFMKNVCIFYVFFVFKSCTFILSWEDSQNGEMSEQKLHNYVIILLLIKIVVFCNIIVFLEQSHLCV